MNAKTAIRISAIVGFLGVGLGAFGAHGLEELLVRNERLATWETAVLYHFVHTIMMFIVATRPQFNKVAWIGFFVGLLIFSGSLYILALTNVGWLGAITPLGGLSFLLGWAWLAWKPQAAV